VKGDVVAHVDHGGNGRAGGGGEFPHAKQKPRAADPTR
jgi:hypothetical protein